MAVEQYRPVLQITGFQNSGKTTLTEKLIHAFSDRGWSTGTIKHHGHGGTPDSPEDKDSGRHLAAGASAAFVEGGGMLHIQSPSAGWSLERLIEAQDLFAPDIVLVEGYKKASYPKVVMIRTKTDMDLLKESEQVLCFISWDETLADKEIPVFSIEESPQYIEFIINRMRDAL